jgi:putative membrane protein
LGKVCALTSTRPVLIDMEGQPPADPALALPVPDGSVPDRSTAMQQAAALAARPGSAIGSWFWGLAGAIFTFILSLAAWNYVTGLLASAPILGWVATVLFVAFLIVLTVIALRELAAFSRLSRLDAIQKAADRAVLTDDLAAAREVVAQLHRLYASRPDTAWGRERLTEREAEILDADGVLGLAETVLLAPLDLAASREVEAAARQVAVVTAVVPLAMADVVAALTSNLRMIRRIAEIYGGRSGTFGAWRLTRTVLTHLVATGAVAVGDDLIGSVAGGSVLSRISRRFGEGVVNGALTARVGVAAIEVCRPLPFRQSERPSVSGIVRRALSGLFGTAKEET